MGIPRFFFKYFVDGKEIPNEKIKNCSSMPYQDDAGNWCNYSDVYTLEATLARREEQLKEMCNNTRYWIRVYASVVPGAKHREHVDYIKTQRILAELEGGE